MNIASSNRSALRGLSWTTAQTWVVMAAQLGLMIALSRFVSPAEFGIYAAAYAPVALATTLSQLGVSAAVVRSNASDDVAVGAGLALSLIVSAAGFCAILAAVAGPALGMLGLDAQVAPVVRVLSISVILGAVGASCFGALQRAQRFAAIAFVQIVSSVLNVLVALVAALAGWGTWALATGFLASQVCIALLGCWLVRPWPRIHLQEFREILGFSVGFVWLRLIDTASSTLDRLVVATYWGVGAAGLYQRAMNIRTIGVSLSAGPIDTFSYGRMVAKLSDKRALVREYDNAVVVALMTSAPLAAGVIVAARELTPVLFGPQWTSAGPMIQLVALALPARAVDRVGTVLARAAGRQLRRIVIGGSTVGLVLVLLFLLREQSLYVAALATTLVFAASALPGLWQASRILEIPLLASLAKLVRPLGAWTLLTLAGLAAKAGLVWLGAPAWAAALATSGLVAVSYVALAGLAPRLLFAPAPSDLIAGYRRRAFKIAFGRGRRRDGLV